MENRRQLEMNDINKWFYSLTLHELHQYIVKLEFENERLIKELNESSKLNGVLENIAKSTQTGYTILRRIEINKNCECNEHLNPELRKSLNESINETNLLLNHLQLYHSARDSENAIPSPIPDTEEFVDLSSDHSNHSPIPINIRRSFDDKDSIHSSSSFSSGYESMDYSTERAPDMAFRNNYRESHSSKVPTEKEMPQNLSKPKSPQFSPIYKPVAQRTDSSSTQNISFPSSAGVVNKPKPPQHLPNKCIECDLSFNLKPSLEQHMLTHVRPTLIVQRAGRGRPAKNDSRILRVNDSGLNILGINEGMAGLSALDKMKIAKCTGFGRYRCPWPDCGYTPHFLRDLRRHMFKHTGDKKYKCDIEGCDFITVWKTSLLQHQRKKHNMNDTNTLTQNNTNKI